MKALRLFLFASSLPFVVLLISSCKKERKYQDAIVINAGDPAVDGCGWLIKLGSTEFKPTNLTPDYQIDQLEVRIKYDLLNSHADCGFAQNVLKEMRLEDIKRK